MNVYAFGLVVVRPDTGVAAEVEDDGAGHPQGQAEVVERTAGDDAGPPEFAAGRAIDADAATLWKARATGNGVHPSLTVDMGRARRIGGFAYLPRQDWVFEGVVDRYRFETSLDGPRWTTRVAVGAFDNMVTKTDAWERLHRAPQATRLPTRARLSPEM